MRSPFPGMDPYIETRNRFEDFHDDFINAIKGAVAEVLPERYIVRAGERSYIELADPVEGRTEERHFKPDVMIREASWDVVDAELTAVAVVAEEYPEAFVMHGLIELEYREPYLEIRDVDQEGRLVTGIEVVSPSNKRYGSVGWERYARKRQVFLDGQANFVEIDLVRSGRRHPMREPWPDSPYYVCVFRKEKAPAGTVWPAHYRQPLPTIPIPLLPPDADIKIALQPMVDAVYARSRYYKDIDYTRPLRPPLSEADAAWLRQQS